MNAPTIPYEMEAEIALIGSIFLDESVIIQSADILVPDDFYDVKNRLIYKTMVSLYKEGKHIDPATVLTSLSSAHILEQCGGTDYISKIADFSYSTANVDTYIDLIQNASLRRNTIYTLNNLAQKGYDNKTGVFDYLENVEKSIFELSSRRRVDSFRTIKQVSKEVLKNTEKNATMKSEIIGLDTGFPSLNRYTQGFQSGQLIILAARTSVGKSAMALNLALNIAEKNKGGKASVAIFSLEMSAEQLAERLIAADGSVELGKIKTGKMDQSAWVRFTTSCSKLGELNLFFDDSSDSSIASIRAKCRKLKADSGLDFVVVDYLQLIESDLSSQKASQQEKISRISRNLKLMARELEVPVLALSQLSREVDKRENKRPIMSDLRESGSIEQDADIILFLYRGEYYNDPTAIKGLVNVIIAKNRSGSTSTEEGLKFSFTGALQKFMEYNGEGTV